MIFVLEEYLRLLYHDLMLEALQFFLDGGNIILEAFHSREGEYLRAILLHLLLGSLNIQNGTLILPYL